jgi:hypothetical protein
MAGVAGEYGLVLAWLGDEQNAEVGEDATHVEVHGIGVAFGFRAFEGLDALDDTLVHHTDSRSSLSSRSVI